MINPNFGGFENDRWNRICKRVNMILDKLEKYKHKLAKMELDDKDRKVRENIAMIGVGIAEARILAEEGGVVYIDKSAKALADARLAKDGVYGALLGDRKFSLEIMYELRDNPLAIKAKRIYEIGVSNIEKYFN